MDGSFDQFNSLCRLSERAIPGIALSIYRLTPQQRLVQCAAPSLPKAMRPVFRDIPIGRDVGSCGTAAWTGRQVRIDDISTDTRWEGLSQFTVAKRVPGLLVAPDKGG